MNQGIIVPTQQELEAMNDAAAKDADNQLQSWDEFHPDYGCVQMEAFAARIIAWHNEQLAKNGTLGSERAVVVIAPEYKEE